MCVCVCVCGLILSGLSTCPRHSAAVEDKLPCYEDLLLTTSTTFLGDAYR